MNADNKYQHVVQHRRHHNRNIEHIDFHTVDIINCLKNKLCSFLMFPVLLCDVKNCIVLKNKIIFFAFQNF
jgi:hypothetical protein